MSQASSPQFVKGVYDILDYTVDYTAELDRIGQTIASSSWVMGSGTVDGSGNTAITLSDSVTPTFGVAPSPSYSQGGTAVSADAKKATCFIGGGTNGNTYTVENAIITTGSPPRRYSRQMQLTVRNR